MNGFAVLAYCTAFKRRIIYLGQSLPNGSSSLPGIQKKTGRFLLPEGRLYPCLTLLRLRVAWPPHCCGAGGLLHRLFTLTLAGGMSLWPDLAGSSEESPPRVLPGSLPYGARTFLEGVSNLTITAFSRSSGQPGTQIIPNSPIEVNQTMNYSSECSSII